MPELFNMLNKTEILQCRLVCKDWATAVDDFLGVFFLRNRNFLGNKDFKQELYISPKQHYQTAQDQMQQHPRNPFVAKSVQISTYAWRLGESIVIYDPNEDTPENLLAKQARYTSASNLIQNLGKHIRILDFYGVWVTQLTHTGVLQLLRDALEFCPNMMQLELRGFVKDYDINEIGWQFEKTLSYPEHKQLTNFRSGSNQEMITKKLLESYSNQLRSVRIFHFFNDYLKIKWGSLEKLVLVCDNLPNFGNFSAPNLKTLDLTTRSGSKLKALDIYELVKCFPKLNELSMELTPSENFELDQRQLRNLTTQTKISCPLLESLELKFDRGTKVPSFDFLILFPGLKILKLEFVQSKNFYFVDHPEFEPVFSTEHIIKILEQLTEHTSSMQGSGHCLYESNIWKILSCLQELQICVRGSWCIPEKIEIQKLTRDAYNLQRA